MIEPLYRRKRVDHFDTIIQNFRLKHHMPEMVNLHLIQLVVPIVCTGTRYGYTAHPH